MYALAVALALGMPGAGRAGTFATPALVCGTSTSSADTCDAVLPLMVLATLPRAASLLLLVKGRFVSTAPTLMSDGRTEEPPRLLGE
jgi:hypothetical protein